MGAAPRCPEAKKLLDLKWASTSQGELADAKNKEEVAGRLADQQRPALVLLSGSTKKEIAALKRMEAALKDERVSLGAKFFRLVKMNGAMLGRSGPTAKLLGGRKLPRLVLIGPAGKYVKKYEAKVSASRLFKDMKRVVKKSAGHNLGTFVDRLRKLLNRIDSLSARRKAVAKERSRLKEKKGGGRKLKALEEAEAELAGEQKDIDKQVAELMGWLKPVKTAKAGK